MRSHRWTGDGPCPRDGLHRLANVHQGFHHEADPRRGPVSAVIDDLDAGSLVRSWTRQPARTTAARIGGALLVMATVVLTIVVLAASSAVEGGL